MLRTFLILGLIILYNTAVIAFLAGQWVEKRHLQQELTAAQGAVAFEGNALGISPTNFVNVK